MPNTIRIAIAQDAQSLDPARADPLNESSATILYGVYQRLTTYSPGTLGKVIPDLAEAWEISEDGMVVTFRLKEDAKFANGDQVTAEDVVFSFNRLKNISGAPAYLAQTIASVEEVDNITVTLTLSQPDPAILAKLAMSAFSVLNQEQVEAQGGTDSEDAASQDQAEEWLKQNSAGSGPYTFD